MSSNDKGVGRRGGARQRSNETEIVYETVQNFTMSQYSSHCSTSGEVGESHKLFFVTKGARRSTQSQYSTVFEVSDSWFYEDLVHVDLSILINMLMV